jgi:hypothetical protein
MQTTNHDANLPVDITSTGEASSLRAPALRATLARRPRSLDDIVPLAVFVQVPTMRGFACAALLVVGGLASASAGQSHTAAATRVAHAMHTRRLDEEPPP